MIANRWPFTPPPPEFFFNSLWKIVAVIIKIIVAGQKTMFSLRNKRRLVKKSDNLNNYGPFFIIFPLPVKLKFKVDITTVHLFTSICTYIGQFHGINLCRTWRVYFSWTPETWRWRHKNHASTLSTITNLIAAKQTVATFHNKRRKIEDAIAIFYGKKSTSFILLIKLFG